MIKSKKVVNGTAVSRRGPKLVVHTGKRLPLLGVYTSGYEQKMITMDGNPFTVRVPEGVITGGPALVRAASEPDPSIFTKEQLYPLGTRKVIGGQPYYYGLIA